MIVVGNETSYLCLMKLLLILFLAIVMLACTKPARETTTAVDTTRTQPKKEDFSVIPIQPERDSLRGSIKSQALGTLGKDSIIIQYYSPAVRDRIIWGGLVPLGQVWVTGAHNATNIRFTCDVEMDGKLLPAGRYAFFTIPGNSEWTVIFNTRWRQHLADSYDKKEDALRLVIKPEQNQSHQERLRYVIESRSETEASLIIQWEKIKIAVPIKKGS